MKTTWRIRDRDRQRIRALAEYLRVRRRVLRTPTMAAVLRWALRVAERRHLKGKE